MKPRNKANKAVYKPVKVTSLILYACGAVTSIIILPLLRRHVVGMKNIVINCG